MTASAQRAAEPSMEEILASIRRIIADDQSRARLGTRLASVSAPAEETAAGTEQSAGAMALSGGQRARDLAPPAEGESGTVAPTTAVGHHEETDGRADAPHDAPAIQSIPAHDPAKAELGAEPTHYAASEPHAAVNLAPSELAPVAKLEAEVAKLVEDTFAQETFAEETFAQESFAQESFAQESFAPGSRDHDVEAYDEPPTEHPSEEIATPQISLPAAPPEPRSASPFEPVPASALAVEPRRPQISEAAASRAPAYERASAPADRRDMRSPEPVEGKGNRAEARGRDAGAILSSETDVAVARAFNTLSRTVLSDNARTLEDLVTEMLRPLLKAWLDDNLPPLVERLVRKEIERVARGRPAD
jgi:cell pole-organizing protein PopZ